MSGADHPDLLEDAIDVGGGDQTIVGPQQRGEPVTDGTLQVREDLGPVGIDAQTRAGLVEVACKPVVGDLVEPILLDMSCQPDIDRPVHWSPAQFVDEGRQTCPVRSERREVLPTRLREAVVLARRTRC